MFSGPCFTWGYGHLLGSVQYGESKNYSDGNIIFRRHFSAQKCRCRLLHPNTNKPIHDSHSFIADINGFHGAFTSTDGGAFFPFIPNNSQETINLERGHKLGFAYNLNNFSYLNDHQAVESFSTATPPPRKHTKEEIQVIDTYISQALQRSKLPPAVEREYKNMLMQFEDVFSADTLDIGHTDVIRHKIEITDPNTRR